MLWIQVIFYWELDQFNDKIENSGNTVLAKIFFCLSDRKVWS